MAKGAGETIPETPTVGLSVFILLVIVIVVSTPLRLPPPVASSPLSAALLTGSYLSAAPVVADLTGDGRPEIIAASDAVYVWDASGSPLPGWPQRTGNFIASTPAVADIDGDGLPEVLAGSDDDRIYAWHADGTPVAGWPVQTGNDVFSTPVVEDLDRDGVPEIVVGSDDGGIYVIEPNGTLRPGWPVRTGGFVSATATVVDLDRDGGKDVVIGSWDRKLHALHANGTPLDGWPVAVGAPVWSRALVLDLSPAAAGDEVLVAADQLYAWTREGAPVDGWPQRLRTYTVSSPVAAELDGDPSPEVVVGGDALWAFNGDGSLVPGWPHATGAYVWATPLVVDLDGDSRDAVIAGDFGGRVHVTGPGGREISDEWPQQVGGRVVAQAVVGWGLRGGTPPIIVPSWDKRVHIIPFHPGGRTGVVELPLADLPATPPLAVASWRLEPPAGLPVRVVAAELTVAPVQSFTLTYYDQSGGSHPSPFLLNGTRYEALIAPLGVPRVNITIEARGWDGAVARVPAAGTIALECPGGC